jgi:alpha-tubulin suppressor-like RCC1 family protein
LVLKSDSTVWAWGRNDYGALGNGTLVGSIIPQNVTGLTDVIEIEAGDFFSAALKSDSTVWVWGHNNSGQLGIGNSTNSSTPIQIPTLTGVTHIAAGRMFMLAIKSDSTVWAWGLNDQSQAGTGAQTPSVFNTPIQVPNLDSIIDISASRYAHALALKSDGTVWAWGYNQFGQVGNATNTISLVPTQVINLNNIIALPKISGYGHSLALKSDSTVWSWGYNLNGQLGNGTNTDTNIAVQVNNLSGVIAITCGDNHSLALKADGTIWAWGYNASGQLGDGTTLDAKNPVQVSGICQINTGVGHVDNLIDINIWPNPSEGIFNVSLFLEKNNSAIFEIYNLQGQLILKSEAIQSLQQHIVNLINEKSGIYILKITLNKTSYFGKLIKQ